MERAFYGRDGCNEKKNKKNLKKTNSQAALLTLFSCVRPSPDLGWRSAPDGAHRHQLVRRQIVRFFHFGSVLLNNHYKSPNGCEVIHGMR